MSFVRPSLKELAARIASDFDAWLSGADSRLRRSVLDVFGRVIAAAAHGLYGAIADTARQILPDTADGEFLARHASLHGLTRKAAVSARGNVNFAGIDGSVIDAGTLLVRSDGARFLTQGAGMIAAGVAAIAATAEAPGVEGNCPAAQRLTLISPVAGIQSDALVAAAGLMGGAAQESDEALLARLLLRLRNPAHGGNPTDYQNWALEVPGVTRAWVFPGWMGAGDVGVSFVMDGRPDIIPTPGDVAAVDAHINPLQPVSGSLTVFAPVGRHLQLQIRAVPPTLEVEAAIRAEVSDLLFREAELGGTLLLSHVREAISIAQGETDHELLFPLSNISADPGELFSSVSIAWVA
jgi:uncharacterized phage protein gp47/JayE